jgi:hypothetical protein
LASIAVSGLPIDRVLTTQPLAVGNSRSSPNRRERGSNTGMFEYAGQISVDQRDIVNADTPLRHDADKLADALIDVGRQHLSRAGERASTVLRANRAAASPEPAFAGAIALSIVTD